MARKKIALRYIADDSSRKASFRKRRGGLLKKAYELTTLCDVKGCLILYGQNESEPEVWPSIPEAIQVLAKLKKMPQMEQIKNMMDQEAFTRNRIRKLENQLRKMERENRDIQTQTLMNDCLTRMKTLDVVYGVEELMSLGRAVDMKLNEVKRKMEECKTNNMMKAKEEKGKAVVNVEEEFKIPEWITNYDMNPINCYNDQDMYGHFVTEPLNIIDPVGSSGTDYMVDNPWIDHFKIEGDWVFPF